MEVIAEGVHPFFQPYRISLLLDCKNVIFLVVLPSLQSKFAAVLAILVRHTLGGERGAVIPPPY